MGIFGRHPSPPADGAKPTIVVVHGAFADATAFGDVAARLIGDGFPVMAVANPLRDLHGDAAYVRSVLDTVAGPVVLVGHSYAGSVITQAAAGAGNVKALVYVAAFIPQAGESSAELNGRYPGSQLTPDNLILVPTPDGRTDLYIKPERYEEVYAGGLSAEQVRIAAFAQRPITSEALGGVVSEVPADDLPKWQVVATEDHAVPAELQRSLADRAGAKIIEADCGHDVAAARPEQVIEAVLAAAAA
ncbi:alpha/beta hydrolase [Amycolatopsis sp. NPDC021455]|uniref:alpha/beta hydrolase n=1 Tax=Amycolatopsis sp. NPDC021455 TaxID=3154901 RepID=UPI0033E4602B